MRLQFRDQFYFFGKMTYMPSLVTRGKFFDHERGSATKKLKYSIRRPKYKIVIFFTKDP